MSALLIMAAAAIAVPVAPDEIVVTALPAPSGGRAYDIVAVGRDRLALSPSGRIEDILGDIAGFQQFRRTDSRAANPTSQGATLRALGGNASSRALVLLDGAPVANPFAGYIPWFALAPERLGAARVTRGAGAGAFGSGALAGTIELDSAPPMPGIGAEADYGSRNSLTASAIAGATAGTATVAVFARYDRGDGYVLVPESQRGAADIPARYAQGSIGFRAVVPAGDDAALSVDALGFADRRTRGLAGNTSGSRGVVTSVRLTSGGRWRYDALAYLNVQEFTTKVVVPDAARATTTPSLDQYRNSSTGIGGKVEVRPPLGPVELRLGIDVRHDEGVTNEASRFVAGRYTRLRDAGGREDIVGGFVEASATPVRGLTLTGGARVDRWRIAGGFLDERDAQTFAPTVTERPANRSRVEPTARGGAAYTLAPGISVRAAAYLGYRLPTLNELYRPFRVGADAVAANSGLVPERLRGAEAGVDLAPATGVRVTLTAFTNRVANAVANVALTSGPGTFAQVGFVAAGGRFSQRRNLAAIVARGIEAEARIGSGPLRLTASYAYTDARVRQPGSALDGRPPAQTPAQAASATLAWERGVHASITARYTGAAFEDDLGTRRLTPALTADAVVELPVGRRLSIVARAENLADALVESGISSTGIVDRGTPRTLWLGLRLARP